MTEHEIRTDLSQSLVGAGTALGLLVKAMEQSVEPSAFSAKENEVLHQVFAQARKIGEALEKCGAVIRAGSYRAM
jgi:hypothetical protein